MNNITYAVSVDVNNPIIPYNVYVASVLDSNVRYLEITLYQNGDIITLSDTATATASLVTDDVLIDDSVECTISNNIITVPLEDLQRHGNLDVQVTVTEDTKVLAIPFPIQVRVTPNIAENAQIDENSLGSYAEVVHEITEARGSYDKLKDRLDHTAAGTVLSNGSSNELVKADSTGKLNRSGAFVSNDQAKIINSSSVEKYVPTARAVAKKLSGYAPTSSVPTKVSDLENDSDFASNDDVFEALDGALSGDSSNEPALLIDDTVDQTSNPDGNIILYYVDSDGTRHNLFNFSQVLCSNEAATEMIDTALSGDSYGQNMTLNLDNNVDQGANPYGHLMLYYIDSDWTRHNVFDFTPYLENNVSSAVVNQNGTITFTLDDGTTFTTTGSSVIGSDGYSPTIITAPEYLRTRVDIIDINGMQYFYINDGESVKSAIIDANGDLIITIQGKPSGSSVHPTYPERIYNVGHVVGADGYSPTATVTQTQNGAVVSITDKNGTTTANISNGADGSDYILTAQDKSDIADLVLAELPTTQGVQYGNTSN